VKHRDEKVQKNKMQELLGRAWDMVYEVSTDYDIYTPNKYNLETNTYIAGEQIFVCAKCHRERGTPHVGNCIVGLAEELLKEMDEFK